MLRWTLSILLLWSGAAAADVGFRMDKAPDGANAPIEMAIWYPTTATAAGQKLGPLTLQVAMNAPVAGNGKKLPVVLFSHGNGGSMLGHHDTAAALAEAGFLVVAPLHTGDNFRDQSRATHVEDRPRHLKAALDHVLATVPEADGSRVGVFGFSAGGFTALSIAGGVADLAQVKPHCVAHPDFFDCKLVAARGGTPELAPDLRGLPDPRIKAAVVAAPALGFTFGKAGLAGIKVPVQLWSAEQDQVLPPPFYAEAVRDALPTKPEFHSIANAGHMDFLAPCSAAYAAAVPPAVCASPPGFDRAAFHKSFDTAVVGFFQKNL